MPKILIVDDELKVMEVLEKFLKMSGYEVLAAEDGEKALGILGEDCGIDLVILDSKMPKMRGEDMLKRFREVNIKTPVILLSGDINIAGRLEEFERLGCSAEDILSKPISLPELDKIIKRKLERGRM